MMERKLLLTSRVVCWDRIPSVRVRRMSPRARWLLIERVTGSCAVVLDMGFVRVEKELKDRHHFIKWVDGFEMETTGL